MPFKSIIVALNGVEEEDIVINKAFSMAKVLNARITVVHINDTDAGKVHMMMDYFPKVTEEDIKKRIMANGFEDLIPSIEFKIQEDENPSEGIMSAIKSNELLVMGHHKKNFVLSLLTVGTDRTLSNNISCPLLIIPMD